MKNLSLGLFIVCFIFISSVFGQYDSKSILNQAIDDIIYIESDNISKPYHKQHFLIIDISTNKLTLKNVNTFKEIKFSLDNGKIKDKHVILVEVQKKSQNSDSESDSDDHNNETQERKQPKEEQETQERKQSKEEEETQERKQSKEGEKLDVIELTDILFQDEELEQLEEIIQLDEKQQKIGLREQKTE